MNSGEIDDIKEREKYKLKPTCGRIHKVSSQEKGGNVVAIFFVPNNEACTMAL